MKCGQVCSSPHHLPSHPLHKSYISLQHLYESSEECRHQHCVVLDVMKQLDYKHFVGHLCYFPRGAA